MNILSATDFLPKSEPAVERAAFLAEMLEAELTIVHAVEPATPDGHTLDERMRSAKSRLALRTSRPEWRWNSTPDVVVQFGLPARVVLDQAHRRNSRLVVLGPHRNDTLPNLVSGTIAERLLDASHCPLLIVRRETRGPYRDVLIALDDTPNAGEVVRTVESLHLTDERPPTVVHAHEPMYAGMMNMVGVQAGTTDDYVAASRTQAHSRIGNLLHRHSSEADRYQLILMERRPTAAILGTLERLQPDLVVLGMGARGQFRRAVLGTVASDVARAAQCDVLLVPSLANSTRQESHQRTPCRETTHSGS